MYTAQPKLKKSIYPPPCIKSNGQIYEYILLIVEGERKTKRKTKVKSYIYT